jgi:hypothetical protein
MNRTRTENRSLKKSYILQLMAYKRLPSQEELNETNEHVERALENFQLTLNQSEESALADILTGERPDAEGETLGDNGDHGGGHGGHAADDVPPVR